MKIGRNPFPNFGKPSGKSLKLYAVIIVILTIIWIFYLIRKQPNVIPIRDSQNENYVFKDIQTEYYMKSEPFEGDKIVHLDLKGAPPIISYYEKLFPILSKFGATGILIEYEDMFPYTGALLGNVSALNAYTMNDIKLINKLANENHLKVIPLIPTFGHMEFILKLSEFKEYREVTTYPQVICPTHENTLKMIQDMIQQIIVAHPDSEMIHIGADEVYYLGVCERCTDAMAKYNSSKNVLFLEHINNIVGFINEFYPHLNILMWDDQFRSITTNELKMGYLNKNIQPVVWSYAKDVYNELGPSLWDTYAHNFAKIWVASAFKGATGSYQVVSDTTHYLENHRIWLSVIAEYKDRINFEGIIITGWQRYDHFAVLCELLPVGIPTLAMSLRLLLGYNESSLSLPMDVAKILDCEKPYDLMDPIIESPNCSYPGAAILEYVLHLQQLKQEFESMMNDPRVHGWLSEYNIAHSFSSPNYVETATSFLSKIRDELNQIDSEITSAMLEVYDNFTVDEWRETYIRPFQEKVNTMWKARKAILSKESWRRRPLLDEF